MAADCDVSRGLPVSRQSEGISGPWFFSDTEMIIVTSTHRAVLSFQSRAESCASLKGGGGTIV